MGREVVQTWKDLREFEDYPKDVVTRIDSLRRFQRHLRRITSSTLFVESRGDLAYLGEEVKNIRAGDIYVIDMANISSEDEQAFIVGDIMKSIDEMYLEKIEMPAKILILIDELNRYAPRSQQVSQEPGSVSFQVIEIARTGRSRGTILFGAQQFKSGVDRQVNENCGTHALGRTGSSELSDRAYRFLDPETKFNATRLNQGELILTHPTFRRPVKIIFPKPSYKRQTAR